jgi:hypothetical protein
MPSPFDDANKLVDRALEEVGEHMRSLATVEKMPAEVGADFVQLADTTLDVIEALMRFLPSDGGSHENGSNVVSLAARRAA